LPDAEPGLEALLAAYLEAETGVGTDIADLVRCHGGAARETFLFTARTATSARRLVLRRDPGASLIATSRAVEYHALSVAHRAGLLVPEPLYLEETAFGAPGFIMAAIEGGSAGGLFEAEPYGAHGATLGRALFRELGRLHALVPDRTDLMVLPEGDARARLHHWAREIATHRTRPEPVADAVFRWLDAHVPAPSGPPAIVHGDFRSGNFLHDGCGRLLAVLDWEMAHVGDPMEDLAWAADPLWGHGDPNRVGGMLPLADAVAAWEETGGRRFVAEAWGWWQLFAAYAGLAIWITSGHEVARMGSVDPVMAFSSLYPYRFHNARAARLLQAIAA
jgi:aminoglycoside phosphotransferase (APT) family kinase protein